MAYTERGAVEPLQRGETIEVTGHGNSMTPLLLSGETVTVEPVPIPTPLAKGDVVIAKVKGNIYMHLITAIDGDRVTIGNNHGKINGWTRRKNVYGRWKRS